MSSSLLGSMHASASGASSSNQNQQLQNYHHPTSNNINVNLNKQSPPIVPAPISAQDATSGTLSLSTSLTDGGYDYELLGGAELLDARYECPICLLYLRDPVLTHCGHKFCFYCISQWIIKEGGRCPVDGNVLTYETMFPDNFTRREIMQCKAKCPFQKDGCSIILSLSELEKHIQLEHHSSPGKLNNTSNPSSPSNDMVSCMYKDVGCFTYVPREQLQKHLETEVHHHLQLITAAYRRLKSSRISNDYPPREYFLRQDSRESTKWLLADETIDSDDYQFRRQRSWDSVRFARKYYVGPKYSDKLAESDESLGKSESHTNSPHSSHSHNLNKTCELKSSSTEGLSGQNGNNSIELKNVYERLVRLEQIDREKQIKIDHLESQLSSALNLCSSVTQVMDDITARYSHGVFIWKISGLKKLCLEMRRNPNRVLNSPGFYTDTFGYKLCLRFNLTTIINNEGAAATNVGEIPLEQDGKTFVSLYIHFMKGEFDDTLRWPFHGELKLSIIHPTSPEASISEIMHSKPDAAAFAKPSLARNIKGFGYAEFCPLNKIFTGGFVKENTLICRILAKAQ